MDSKFVKQSTIIPQDMLYEIIPFLKNPTIRMCNKKWNKYCNKIFPTIDAVVEKILISKYKSVFKITIDGASYKVQVGRIRAPKYKYYYECDCNEKFNRIRVRCGRQLYKYISISTYNEKIMILHAVHAVHAGKIKINQPFTLPKTWDMMEYRQWVRCTRSRKCHKHIEQILYFIKFSNIFLDKKFYTEVLDSYSIIYKSAVLT
jgi:hypothetical protein